MNLQGAHACRGGNYEVFMSEPLESFLLARPMDSRARRFIEGLPGRARAEGL
jgi:hypothetical protein